MPHKPTMRIAVLGGQLALLLLAALFLAIGVNALVAAELVRSVPPVQLPPELGASQSATAQAQASTNVLLFDRNLFYAGEEPEEGAMAPAEPASGEPDAAPAAATTPELSGASDLPYTLIGTMVAEPKAWSIAYLRHNNTQEEVYAGRGYRLEDAVLVQVARTFIVVRRGGGAFETIGLAGAEGPALPDRLRMGSEAQAQEADADELRVGDERRARRMADGQPRLDNGLVHETDTWVRREADGKFVLDREATIEQLEHAEEAAERLGLTPIGGNGEPLGLRVSQVEDDTLFAAIGLVEGDVIVSVEGRPTQNPGDMAKFMKDLARQGRTTIEVDRRGTREKIELRAE